MSKIALIMVEEILFILTVVKNDWITKIENSDFPRDLVTPSTNNERSLRYGNIIGRNDSVRSLIGKNYEPAFDCWFKVLRQLLRPPTVFPAEM